MRRKRPIYADTYARRRRVWLTVIIVAIVAVLAGGGWWLTHRNPRPSASRYPLMGVRVDQTDGVLDSTALQEGGASFVYLKATQGASFVDDNFATNFDRAQGLKVGVYHYFSFDSTPQAQAANFIKHVGVDAGDLPIGLYVTYYGDYASDPPSKTVVAAKLNALIAALNAQYHQGVMLMGSAAALKTIQTVAPSSPRWVIAKTRPASATFWEYATAKLPKGGDKTYACAVYMKGKTLQ